MIRSRLAAALRSLADRLAPLPAEPVFIGAQDGEGDDALYPSGILRIDYTDAMAEWFADNPGKAIPIVVAGQVMGAGGGGGAGTSFGMDGFGGGPVGAPA